MSPTRPLSARETEVVSQLLLGKSNKQIALALGITVRTVEFHLHNIYTIHAVQSRVELLLHLGRSTGRLPALGLGDSAVAPPAVSADDGAIAPEPGARAPIAGARGDVSQEVGMKTAGNGHIGHALLWATAIIGAALMGASTELTVVFLPALASAALFVTDHAQRRTDHPA